MLHNMCASVKMEEGYMRMSIEYTDPTTRSTICDAIGNIETELNMYPEVIHKRLQNNNGVFCIEFSGNNYICERSSGEFIEAVLKILNIKQCDDH